MCGILFISNNSFSKKQCDDSAKLMNYRGPDNFDSIIINNNYFGHLRLSIIDLNNRSNQPFMIGNKVIIYNGEVYNYKELIKEHNLEVKTDSDTEVVLQMFIKYGKNCLNYFNGMFSFVIYDEKSSEVFIARDRLGIKPLYYRYIGKSIIVSSELKPILNIQSDEIDNFGLRQYKKLRMTIKGYSIYENIKQFPPGHYFDGKSFHKYWDLDVSEKPPPKDDDLKELIIDAVKLRKRSDVPVGSYLSGGLDSTILSYLLKPTHTWTVGFDELNEFKWSTLANSQLKSSLKQVLITKNEFLDTAKKMISKRLEPLSVPNEVLLYHMTKEVANKNTVILSGEGADELFLGYDRIFKWANKIKNISYDEFDKYYCYGSHKDNEVISFALEDLPISKPLHQIGYYFQITHLQGLLRRLDNSTMLCSVEARVPFVDHRLVEMMAGTPFEWRMGKTFKEPLKRIFKELIPNEIIKRKKIGFPVPLESIFDNSNESGFDSWLNYNIETLKKSGKI